MATSQFFFVVDLTTLNERDFLRRDNGDLAREIRNSGRVKKKQRMHSLLFFSSRLLKMLMQAV